MKVILLGATGMVGQGVLRECLLDPAASAGLRGDPRKGETEVRISAQIDQVNRLVRFQGVTVQPGCTKARQMPKKNSKEEVAKELTGKETEPWEIAYFNCIRARFQSLSGRLRPQL